MHPATGEPGRRRWRSGWCSWGRSGRRQRRRSGRAAPAVSRIMRQEKARTPGTDGFIIVAVLWILGALAVLASIYAVFVIDTATAVAANDDRVRAEALVTAGVELAAFRIGAVPEQRPANGSFTFRAGTANVAVRFGSESGRID